MSRIYEALRKIEFERRSGGGVAPEPIQRVDFLQSVVPEPADLRGVPSVEVDVSLASRLVALADPQSLGAEKFRALATRLENQRNQRELKSLQVTSSVAHEGKTLVSTNLAVTLARHSGSKVLLVEGDMHLPAVQRLLGLTELRGISHWWLGRDEEISRYLYRLNDMPLWLLPGGGTCDQPSNILQSARFVEALLPLVATFDWIIVDSTPLLPFVDANLWSRLLDGMLLVIRRGVASIKALKKGLEAIDNPSLVGIVLNDAPDFDQKNYSEKYYAHQNQGPGQSYSN
jgi:capsular exopolysaccharide synthesis family protein